MNIDRGAKLAFVLSLLVFAFLYGVATRSFGIFPNALLERAWRQARATAPPSVTSAKWLTSRVFDDSGVLVRDSEAMSDGYTLVASQWADIDWRAGLRLLDSDGSVVHRWSIRPGASIIDSIPYPMDEIPIHGSHLLPNGDALINLQGTAVVRLDACSRVKWWRRLNGHHAISRAEDGTFWVASRSDTVLDADLTAVFRRKNLQETNKVVHLSADGRTLDRISVLGLLQSAGLLRRIFTERHINYYGTEGLSDVTHLNDVESLSSTMADDYPLFEAGDLLISMKYLNLIMVADPDTREVKWRSTGHPFLRQHDPDFIGDGWIGVFDNEQDGTARGHRLGGSKIVTIQPSTDSVGTLSSADEANFYTGYGGKWQMLDDGNLLLTEMAAGRVVEVTPTGKTVWEWVREPFNKEQVPEVSEATRYPLTEKQMRAWPCSS